MDPFENHTFQPGSGIRRGDLAMAVSRLVASIADRQDRRSRALQPQRPTIADVPPVTWSIRRRGVGCLPTGVMPLVEGTRFQVSRPVSARRPPSDGSSCDWRWCSADAVRNLTLGQPADDPADRADSGVRAARRLRLSGQGAARVHASPASPTRSTVSSRGAPASARASAPGSIRWPTSCCW